MLLSIKWRILVTGLVKHMTDINVRAESQCFQKSVEAACYFELPICVKNARNQPTAKRLCRRECEALYPLCKKEVKGSVK